MDDSQEQAPLPVPSEQGAPLPETPGLVGLPVSGAEPLELPAVDGPRVAIEAPTDGTPITIPVPAATVTNLDGSTPARSPDGRIPAAPVAGGPVGVTLASCTLQPNARYGDEPLAAIPAWSEVAIGILTTPDERGRPWQQVRFGDLAGYVQLQNLRIGR